MSTTPSQQAQSDRGGFQAIKPGASQAIAYTGTSATSTAFSGTIIRVVSTTNCFIKIGQGSQTATTAYTFLPAGVVEYFAVHPEDCIAAIRSTDSGTLYVTEGA